MNKLNELPVAQQFELIRREWNNFDHLAIQSPTGRVSLALPALLSGNGMVEQFSLFNQEESRDPAKRLAALLGAKVGDEVGYQVRFDSSIPQYEDHLSYGWGV